MNHHQQLESLLARQAITDQIHRYCHAIDRCDLEMLSSVFHANSTHEHGSYQGSSAAFCGFAMDLLEKIDATQHIAGNVLIDIVSESLAFSETYWISHHRIAAGIALPSAFADHNLEIDEDVMIGGRYIDRFERRDNVWKIAHRTGIHDWQRWMISDPRGFLQLPAGQRGGRSPDDVTYRFTVDSKPHIFMQGAYHG